MKFLCRWFSLRYRLRARRWRVRALKAEAALANLRVDFVAEMQRNREREDTFVSATVMGSRGMFGVAPRGAPAKSRPKQITTNAMGIDAEGFSWADRQEFDSIWKPDAEAAGIPIHEAKQKFYNEVIVPRRMPLNDDPFSN